MSLEYIGNAERMTVTLGAGYTAGDGSMSLSTGDGALLPSTGDFWLVTTTGTYRAFKVTARSGDTLTVTAAQDGTSDGNLSAGQELEWSLTASALDQLKADIAAGTKSIPVDGSFAWVNQGGATIARANDKLLLTIPASGSDNLRIREVALPGASYTVQWGGLVDLHPSNFCWGGVCLRDSASGRLLSMEYTFQNTMSVAVTRWTSVSAYSTSILFAVDGYAGNCAKYLNLKITDDGTTYTFYYSFDGDNWITMGTENHTFLASPDKAGIYGNSRNNKLVQVWCDNFVVS